MGKQSKPYVQEVPEEDVDYKEKFDLLLEAVNGAPGAVTGSISISRMNGKMSFSLSGAPDNSYEAALTDLEMFSKGLSGVKQIIDDRRIELTGMLEKANAAAEAIEEDVNEVDERLNQEAVG